MRVIAGEFRSRRLKSIPGDSTRPTPDRLRETLFNILAPRIAGATFVDAYAGTGAVGIEALSRGARHVFFLERNRKAIEAIRENLASLKVEHRATVVTGPALLTMERTAGKRGTDPKSAKTAEFASVPVLRAGIVFLDPPYEMEREYGAAMELLAEAKTELVVAQHSVRMAMAEAYGELGRTRVVRQGDNALSFFAWTGGGRACPTPTEARFEQKGDRPEFRKDGGIHVSPRFAASGVE